MPRNSSKLVLATAVIFFFISVSAFVFFRAMIVKKTETVEFSRKAWYDEAVHREEIKILDQTLRNLHPERAELETHFARSSDVVPLLNTLEALAVSVSAKAEISSVDIAKDNTTLFVGVHASGSFSSLYKFINLLENSPYEIKFTLVDFRKIASTEGEGPSWDAVLRLQILSFLPS